MQTLVASYHWILIAAAIAAPPAARDVQTVPRKAEQFELSQVRLLDGPFKDAMLRDVDYLLSLDPERLLHTFRLNAGLPSTVEALGGWEKPDSEVRGFSLGQYLSACSLMYAASGDARFKERVDRIVAALAECQQALPGKGFRPGYLSAFPESFIDRYDDCKRVWAPWYVLNKIFAGLIDAHRICGNRQALDVAVRMGDWVRVRIDRRTPEQRLQAIDSKTAAEVAAIAESLADLAEITGNSEYVLCGEAFVRHSLFDPLAEGKDCLDGGFGNHTLIGRHGNETVLETVGVARLFEVTGEPYYRKAAETYWQSVATKRAYAIGGFTDYEFFFPVRHLCAPSQHQHRRDL